MSYTTFAKYYDALTHNVGYQKRADYLCALLKRYGHNSGVTLDLACGTGSLTLELKQRGFDIYGIDGSSEMLMQAQEKALAAGEKILFVCQQMQAIDLYSTVDTVFCTLDSLNHLQTQRDLQRTFERVSLFLEPDGLFVFDMNTPYKHQKILGDNTFIYDTDSVYCVWQNHYHPAGCRVDIALDFFKRNGAVYTRESEEFFERAYEETQVASMLKSAGMQLAGAFSEMTFDSPQEKTERIVYVARKAKAKVNEKERL
ncbi:MAG: class I SAM-dependent methyltransferase [Oscillospiraceae bacterium]|jgi:ubiquinone/menaquinone biosynthesis C-methylase UbiE|nr:class I SAM-dependent methyltransferase [Oscillospiraceae bacterium]MDD3261411.1 class I SAM-dependent methyltransferase [Oscillospiraceae bacterium]